MRHGRRLDLSTADPVLDWPEDARSYEVEVAGKLLQELVSGAGDAGGMCAVTDAPA